MNKPISIAKLSELNEKEPAYALVSNTDLVLVRYQEEVSVMYGRCLHRGALLSDGFVDGENLICGLHYWDYRIDTGVSEYDNSESLYKFESKIENGEVYIDEDEVKDYEKETPSPFDRDAYLGTYADTSPEDTEPYTGQIQELARNGLKNWGKHGQTVAMGVDRNELPKWKDIQFLPAQLSRRPLMDDEDVNSETIIGPNAKKPLKLSIPLFVTDMSFGALSLEAKIALAKGAEMAGTGICSGEGGMLEEEKEANSRYFYELASAKFGFSYEKVSDVQAFHFKGGQGAKTGTGGHLPGHKVDEKIAEVRGVDPGDDAISPATFTDLNSVEDFQQVAEKVREASGGIPIGFKIAAARIEEDIDFALAVGIDYIILDGRGGATGAAPKILRDNINVPTIAALARARKHLDAKQANDVSLIITGGLRVAEDFTKALMLGADAVAVGNSALQAIGCLGMRACNTNNCPVGIASQKENLRSRLQIQTSAKQLCNFFNATNDLMKVIARSCGYDDFRKFNHSDLSTISWDMHKLAGINYAGIKN